VKKLALTHLFLNLYLLALIQPALPIIEYIVNYDYIVDELCENKEKPILTCNGKCYLEEQVKNQQNLNHDQKIPQVPKLDLEKFLTLKNKQFSYNLIADEKIRQKSFFCNSLEELLFPDSIFRPPIV
jgi:hypothetical protein